MRPRNGLVLLVYVWLVLLMAFTLFYTARLAERVDDHTHDVCTFVNDLRQRQGLDPEVCP